MNTVVLVGDGHELAPDVELTLRRQGPVEVFNFCDLEQGVENARRLPWKPDRFVKIGDRDMDIGLGEVVRTDESSDDDDPADEDTEPAYDEAAIAAMAEILTSMQVVVRILRDFPDQRLEESPVVARIYAAMRELAALVASWEGDSLLFEGEHREQVGEFLRFITECGLPGSVAVMLMAVLLFTSDLRDGLEKVESEVIAEAVVNDPELTRCAGEVLKAAQNLENLEDRDVFAAIFEEGVSEEDRAALEVVKRCLTIIDTEADVNALREYADNGLLTDIEEICTALAQASVSDPVILAVSAQLSQRTAQRIDELS